jgi:hypothetical protein
MQPHSLDEDFEEALARYVCGFNCNRGMASVGPDASLRLDELESEPELEDWTVVRLRAGAADPLAVQLRRVLEARGFDFDSRWPPYDLIEVCAALFDDRGARRPGELGCGLVLLVDELDALAPEQLTELISCLHRRNPRQWELCFVAGAGDPRISVRCLQAHPDAPGIIDFYAA